MPTLSYDDFEPHIRAAFDAYVASLEPEPAPVEPPTPVLVEPPAAVPIATLDLQGTTSGEWSRGFSTQTSRLNFPDTPANRAALLVGRVLRFCDGTERAITKASAAYNRIYVDYAGTRLPPIEGLIGVFEAATPGKPEAPTEVVPAPTDPVVAPLPAGWNLIGTNVCGADFGGSNNVYNKGWTYPNADFKKLVAQGITFGRLPFKRHRVMDSKGAWVQITDSNGRVSWGIDLLETCLDAAQSAGFSLTLDPHDYYTVDGRESTAAEFTQLHQVLATRIGKHEAIVGWELQNEPKGTSGRFGQAVQPVVTMLNELIPGKAVIIPGDSYQSAPRWVRENPAYPVQGDNLWYAVHVYFDKDASGSWKTRDQAVAVDQGEKMMAGVMAWAKQHNARLLIGEHGGPDDNPAYMAALERFAAWCVANSVPLQYWGAGSWWPKGDANALQYSAGFKPQLDVLKKFI
jgi:endoglucanase